MNLYVLDACGIITFLRNEEGADKFIQLLANNNNTILMHALTVGEVYYDMLRINKLKAEELFRIIDDLQIGIIWTLDKELLQQASYYKVNFKMSYADSYVLATAYLHDAYIISTDHHEFDAVEQQTDLCFFWLR